MLPCVSDPRPKIYNVDADRGREIEYGLVRSAFVRNVDDERHFLTLPFFGVGCGSTEREVGDPELRQTSEIRHTRQLHSSPLP